MRAELIHELLLSQSSLRRIVSAVVSTALLLGLFVGLAYFRFASDPQASGTRSAERIAQPTAIYHAFNQSYAEVETFACALANQGYSHLQISPAQQSNPGREWWKRYQPYDLSVIQGLGSERDLRSLTTTAHSCNLKVIADVVFNHMANLDGGEAFEDLTKYPNLSPEDFQTDPNNVGVRPCGINYSDGDRNSELNCWLGGLPDLRFTDNVKAIQKAHLRRLLDLGVDGFRFNNMKKAFTYGGDLRSLPAKALSDSRSVTFGANHDTIRSLNRAALNPYDDITDSYLATAYVLARQNGTKAQRLSIYPH